jgi:hypothetical protein
MISPDDAGNGVYLLAWSADHAISRKTDSFWHSWSQIALGIFRSVELTV